jgi:hypothetical protein
VSETLPSQIFERIRGFSDFSIGRSFSNEILLDTTPVPFFGNINDSSVASVSLNPSSKEFPKTNRRLVHLSDLKLSEDFFRTDNNLDDQQVQNVYSGLINYFNTPYWYSDWFQYPELALNRGLQATYLKSNSSNLLSKACHTDLSPWATKAWNNLDKDVQDALILENLKFLNWFLSRENFKIVVLLGRMGGLFSKRGRNRSGITPFEYSTDHVENFPERGGPDFEDGFLQLHSGEVKRFFLIAYPPSMPNSHIMRNMNIFYSAFGDYIAKRISFSL